MSDRKPRTRMRLRRLGLAAAIISSNALAAGDGRLPSGGQITAGSGTITQRGNVLTVTQDSQRLISEWQRFDIGADARVDFLQPDSGSVALNRVAGGSASQILGALRANGRVYLLNPSGILFGPGAQVDVGGLVASSLELRDSDFLAGRDLFSSGGGAGAVINQGKLNGRVVAMIAPEVRNEGTITAADGSAVLAAGDGVSLDFVGDRLLNVKVDRAAFGALAENQGLIRADGGRVMMSARAAGDLMATVVNNDGIIEARGLVERNGEILLDGGEQGITTNGGVLDVSGETHGGRIVVTGDQVTVDDGARLDARGGSGGGEIFVGGGWQGGDGSIRAANDTEVRAGAVLDASAADHGDGGTVVAWSKIDDAAALTRAYGTLLARGGRNGGNGGRIETSGHHLDVAGIRIDAGAPQGNSGLWLIDPSDITVTTAGTGSLSGGVFDPGGVADTISPATLLAGLATADVTVQTSGGSGGNGDIIVADSINTTADLGATRTLTLRADRDIVFNSTVGINATTGGNTQRLNIVLNSDTDADGVGGITMVGGTLASNGGTIALGGGAAGTASGYTGGLSSVAAYALPGGSAGNMGISIGGGTTLDAGGGNIVLKGLGREGDGSGLAKGIEFVPDDTAGSVTLQTTGTGSITLNGQGDAGGSGDFNYGVDFNNAAGSINGITLSTQNGAIAITGSGGGSGASANNDGTLFQGDNTTVSSSGGGVSLSGTAGSTSGYAIALGGNTVLGGASAGNLTLTGGSFNITGGTLQTAGTLTFNATSATTVSEAGSTVISADKLLLAGAGADYALNTGIHTVNSLAANTGSVDYVDNDALSIGSAGATNGITASGTVSVATLSGDLTVTKNIFAADAGASAVVLNAGRSAAAGTAAGGNVIISGGPTISAGAGGRATFFTGGIAGSTGLTSLVGSGSGRFRYDSDESAANYTTALGSGNYGVYREQPTVTVTADNQILTYGTAPTLSSTITGPQNGDTTAQIFSTAPTVTAGGATSTSGNYVAGSHTLSAGGGVEGLGYAVSYVDGTLTVNQKALAVTYTGVDKVYDGTTSATVTTSDDRAAGDLFTVSHSEVFAIDKNVGVGKAIDVTGVSLSGADAANYTVTATGSATASITPRALDVTYTGLNKVYDGTTDAVVTTSDDRIAGDVLTINRTADFAPDKNVGVGKTIDVTAVSLSGTDAGNYSVAGTGTTTANITPRTLNVTYAGVDRQYDGTTNATVTTTDDRVTGDDLTIDRTATFAPDKDVDSGKAINVTGVSLSGADAGNYSAAATGSATADITPKVLSLAATAADKVYDGDVTATVNGYGLSGFVGSETVVASSTGAVFDDKNVASGKTVTLSGISLSDGANGGLASNYTVAGSTTTTADITPRTLTVTYGGVDKVYDGTVAATVTTADDRVAGDSLSIDRTAAFSDKNVAGGKTVSVGGVSLTDTDAGNYTVAATGSTAAAITAKDLTAVYSAADKVYDGTTAATVAGSSNDIISGDQVSFSETGTFSDKNAATGKTVNVTGIALGGTDAGNYNLLNTTATPTAHILPKDLTITATVAGKIYDGTTTATVQDFTLTGFVGNETVTADSTSADFDTRFVGAGKTVTISGVRLADGSNGGLAANYSVPATLAATADVTPNPYVTNVTSAVTSVAAGINGTVESRASNLKVASDAATPGNGSRTLAAVDRGLFAFGTARDSATTGLTLAVDGAAAPVSFSTVGSTMILHLGFSDAELAWPVSASLPVFTLAQGRLLPRATYNVVDNGSSLAMTEGFAAPHPPRLSDRPGPGALVSLSLRQDVAAQMRVHLDERGALLIAIKHSSALNQDPRTVVLLGLAAAKERLGASLYDIKSVVMDK